MVLRKPLNRGKQSAYGSDWSGCHYLLIADKNIMLINMSSFVYTSDDKNVDTGQKTAHGNTTILSFTVQKVWGLVLILY